jgi:alkylated DNA repair dioxygenase AlkB
MIPYVSDFYSKEEADALFEFCKAMKHVRKKNPRGSALYRRVSYPGYSVENEYRRAGGYDTEEWKDAPPEYLALAARLSAFAGKDINYMSTIGYENELDHIGWHQHKEDWNRTDQTVWVLSLGVERLVGLRKKDEKNKDKWHCFYPAHGSLYVLPSSFNRTHEHAVLDDPNPCGLRIGINCKHLPPALPRIWDCHEKKKYPAAAEYIGCKNVRGKTKWPDTPFGNYDRLKGAAWKAEVARRMKLPEYPALVKGLRGRDLLCWCSPKEAPHCHGNAWLELANPKPVEQEPIPTKAPMAKCTPLPFLLARMKIKKQQVEAIAPIQLAKYDAARRALQAAHGIDEVLEIKNKAEALRAYARQAKDIRMQNWCAEIRLRAERKVGEMLAEMEKNKGAQGVGKKVSHPKGGAPPTLKELGLGEKQSVRWQKLAEPKENAFDMALARIAGSDKEVTTAGVLREIAPRKPKEGKDCYEQLLDWLDSRIPNPLPVTASLWEPACCG